MKFHLLCTSSCQRKHPRSAGDVRLPDYLCNSALSVCRDQCCHNKVGKRLLNNVSLLPQVSISSLPGGMLIKYMQMTPSPPWKMLMWILCDGCCEAHVMQKVTFLCPAGSGAAGFRLLRGFVNALRSDQSVNKYYKIRISKTFAAPPVWYWERRGREKNWSVIVRCFGCW